MADDKALDAAVEVDEAVFVHVADITGVHPDPAVLVGAEDGGGLSRLVVVALHHGGAGDAQLAALADGQLLLGVRLKDGMPTLPSLLFLPAAQVAAEETSVMP